MMIMIKAVAAVSKIGTDQPNERQSSIILLHHHPHFFCLKRKRNTPAMMRKHSTNKIPLMTSPFKKAFNPQSRIKNVIRQSTINIPLFLMFLHLRFSNYLHYSIIPKPQSATFTTSSTIQSMTVHTMIEISFMRQI